MLWVLQQKAATPVHVYLQGFFAHLLGKKTEIKKTARRKVKALCSEEALTADSIFGRVEEEDKQSLQWQRPAKYDL